MSRKDFMKMRVEELPQPGQIWTNEQDELLKITSVFVAMDPEWLVTWNYVTEGGQYVWLPDPDGGREQSCSGSMEVGQFLFEMRLP